MTVSLLCDPEAPDDPAIRSSLARAGVRASPVFVQPRRTLLMDLGKGDEELFAAMRKKTRQYIHKAERDGVITEETRDVDRFLAVLESKPEAQFAALLAEVDRAVIHELLAGPARLARPLVVRTVPGRDA